MFQFEFSCGCRIVGFHLLAESTPRRVEHDHCRFGFLFQHFTQCLSAKLSNSINIILNRDKRRSYHSVLDMNDINTDWVFFPRQISGWFTHKVNDARRQQLTIVVFVELTIFVVLQLGRCGRNFQLFAKFLSFTATCF